jgi:hypothetical protein
MTRTIHWLFCGATTTRFSTYHAAALATLLAAVFLASPCYAALVHQYQLDGSFSDDLGGPSLVPAGGTLGPTSYSFGPNQGLSLSNALSDPGNYSIETIFNFSDVLSFRKIIDFKDRTSDSGLYDLNTSVQLVPIAGAGPANAFVPNVDVSLILTRDGGTGQVVGYINGVQHFSVIDNSSISDFSAANNIIHFFMDDGGTEASAGVVDLIRIYDAPLSASEAAALGGSIPEPAALPTAVIGAAILLLRRPRATLRWIAASSASACGWLTHRVRERGQGSGESLRS